MNDTTQTNIIKLSNTGLIKAEGDDAETFLHNQFTNDLKLVTETTSQLSAYCSPKGRILSLFRIFKRGNAFYLCMPKPLIEATLKRLQMFVMMSKVKLEDASDDLLHLGCSGAECESQLKTVFGTIPTEQNQIITADEVSIIRVPGTQTRFEIFAPASKLQALSPVSDDADRWALMDIESGIPTISPETVEAFVPQMINLQAIDGLSFKKGCYPGQEIVARMQYLGKLKRRMYLVQCDTKQLPKAGDLIFNAERKTGTVVAAQRDTDSTVKILIVNEIEVAENDSSKLFSATGPSVKFLPLSYSLET